MEILILLDFTQEQVITSFAFDIIFGIYHIIPQLELFSKIERTHFYSILNKTVSYQKKFANFCIIV